MIVASDERTGITLLHEGRSQVAIVRLTLCVALLLTLAGAVFAGVQIVVLGYKSALAEQQREREYQRALQLFRIPIETESAPEVPNPSPNSYRVSDGGHTMRIYLSSRFSRQMEMRNYAEQLRAEGIEVVSAWHDLYSQSSDGFSGVGAQRLAWLAMMDVQQLVRTNAIAVFSDGLLVSDEPCSCGHLYRNHSGSYQIPQSPGARCPAWKCEVPGCNCHQFIPSGKSAAMTNDTAVETGMALALGKRVLLVGAPENKFHHLPDVEHFPSWPECFARVLELRGSDAMTTAQAAAEAGITRQRLQEWIRDGLLPAAKRNGHYVIGRNDLDQAKAMVRRKQAESARS